MLARPEHAQVRERMGALPLCSFWGSFPILLLEMVSTVSHYFQVPASTGCLAVWICLVHPSCFSWCTTCNTMLEVKTPQVKTPAGRTPVQSLPQMPSNSSPIFSACNLDNYCSMLCLPSMSTLQIYLLYCVLYNIGIYYFLFFSIVFLSYICCRGVRRNMATAKASETARNIISTQWLHETTRPD